MRFLLLLLNSYMCLFDDAEFGKKGLARPNADWTDKKGGR